MKKYHLMLSENGWEYTGGIYVKCNKITRIDKTTLLIDGIEVEFDEVVEIEGEEIK